MIAQESYIMRLRKSMYLPGQIANAGQTPVFFFLHAHQVLLWTGGMQNKLVRTTRNTVMPGVSVDGGKLWAHVKGILKRT